MATVSNLNLNHLEVLLETAMRTRSVNFELLNAVREANGKSHLADPTHSPSHQPGRHRTEIDSALNAIRNAE